MTRFLLALWCLMGLGGTALAEAPDWATVSGPAGGPPRVIGSVTRGCLAGAVALPEQGIGFQTIRRWRNRYWGHPELIDYIRQLGARVAGAGLGPLLIADMAQPRGGPLPYGHRSHQLGIDVDILFTPGPLDRRSREAMKDPPSMLAESGLTIASARFGAAQIAMLKLAVSDPRVARIFVNFRLKKALCTRVPAGQRGWLRKIRPWLGHDEHFHVRLLCPRGSPLCEAQEAVDPGDGCDASLDAWFKPAPPADPAAPKPPKPPPPVMPAACKMLLVQ